MNWYLCVFHVFVITSTYFCYFQRAPNEGSLPSAFDDDDEEDFFDDEDEEELIEGEEEDEEEDDEYLG